MSPVLGLVRKSVASSTGTVALGTYGAYVANGLVVVLSTLVMTPTDRGVYLSYASWIAFIAALVSLGLGPGVAHLARERRLGRADMARLAVLALVHAAVGAGLIVLAFSTVVSRIGLIAPIVPVVLVLGLAGVMTTDWVGYAMQGVESFRAYALLRVAVPLSSLVAGAATWLFAEPTPLLMLAATSVSPWLVGLIGVFVVCRSVDASRSGGLLFAYRFGVRVGVGAFASALSSKLDAIIVASLLGPAQLSYYSLAMSVGSPVSAAGTAVGVRSFSGIASSENSDSAQQQTRRATSRFLVLSGVCAAGAVVAVTLLPVVFGREYRESQLPALILTAGAVGFGANYLAASMLQAMRRPGWASAGQIVIGLLTAGLVPLGAVVGDTSGAALGSTAAYWAGASVMAALVSRAARRNSAAGGVR